MNYIKTAFLIAILVITASLAPSFVSALETQDNGTTAGASSLNTQDNGDTTGASSLNTQDSGTTAGSSSLNTQDNGTTAGSSSLNTQDNGTTAGTSGLNTQDNGTTAGTSSLNTQDNGTTAGAGPTLTTQDNGTTAGSGGTPSGSSGGSGRARTVASSGVIQISDIKVTLPGSSVPVTSLSRGLRYVISWSASVQNTNTTINFVNTSTGASTAIGVSSNPSSVNTFTWVVPSTLALGDYILRFTDTGNRTTNSTTVYTVNRALVSTSRDAGTGTGTGAGTGAQVQVGTPQGTAGEEEVSGFPLVIGEESEEEDINSQLAAVGEADGFFSKYFLWFLILLLVIAGVILAREQRNKSNTKI